ncbi:MAG TPA: OsmC family protein [Marmoricola sp.]|nr:OsmC family protein [Marmoricola sp.]
MTQATQSTPSDSLRTVELVKMGEGRYKATNRRGGVLPVGRGEDPDFTPTELLLAAIAGCSAIDVDLITGKRGQAERFEVHASGEKIRDEQGNRLTGLRLVFDVAFPEGEAGDAARAVLQDAIEKSRDRLCTVGRTVAVGTPVEMGQQQPLS